MVSDLGPGEGRRSGFRSLIAAVVFFLVVIGLVSGAFAFGPEPPGAVGHDRNVHPEGETCIDDALVREVLAAMSPRRIDPGCMSCHGDIENATVNMGFEAECTWCHGGDPNALTIEQAHVQPTLPIINDNTVAPLDYDLPYQRFVNPANLRVVDQVCLCHPLQFLKLPKALMANAAGHYAGGLYQNGVVDTKTPIYGTFAVTDEDGFVPEDAGAVASLLDLITFDPIADPALFATHFAAVPGQACARCHLWSRGKGYRGAEGKDGVYRADGCAACHISYTDDGRSQSADQTIDHEEQGHARVHILSRAVPTDQCLHCHHRGARIGLSFTGRAQMPPRLPSGPGVPGTTDVRFNGNYHYTDAETNPPDIHHERGLHCVDCHVQSAVMGDGNIWGHMDQATRIECRNCHGLPGSQGTFADNEGNSLWNIDSSGANPILTSKVDQVEHVIPQIMDMLDPSSDRYNQRAAVAMNSDHIKVDGGLECYSCHSSWVPNCFGCHFQRDERELGRNLVTREYEVGKAATDNKVFEGLRHFMMGPNSEGRTAPYIVGCQLLADVTAPDGSKILDFVMPETVNGKSGLALHPVHPHTVRTVGSVRTCEECHRSPPSLGLGSGNYTLARTNAYAVASAGIRVFDRWSNPEQPASLGTIPFAGARAMATQPDVIEGSAEYVFVAGGPSGVAVFDLQNGVPAAPVATITGINAVDISRVSRFLYVVEQGVGVSIYDTADPTNPVRVAVVSLPTAVRAVPWGIHLFVAAGSAGLQVVDIVDHSAPMLVGGLVGMHAADVVLYSHYQMGPAFAARAYVADPGYGIRVVNLLPDFSSPRLEDGIPLVGATGVDTYSRYVPADSITPSREHDFLYVAAATAGLRVFDITEPDNILPAGNLTSLGGSVVHVNVSSQIDPVGVDDYAVLANTSLGLQLVDVTDPFNPSLVTTIDVPGASRVFVDVQPLDRFMDEQGNELKENSHPFVDAMNREDIVARLDAPIEDGLFFACSLPNGSCTEMLQADCVAAGGIVAEYGLTCEDLEGGGDVTPAIPALTGWGATVLALLMIAFGWLMSRRR